MKKIIITLGIILTLGIISVYLFSVFNCKYDYIKSIEIDLPNDSKELKFLDTHGGFHGDGECIVEQQLTEKGAKEFIKNANKTGKWSALPLNSEFKIYLYGGRFNNVEFGEKDIPSKNIPRNLNHGIYYFRDRYAEYYPNEANKSFLRRCATNATISILDTDTNKLYIYEIDT